MLDESLYVAIPYRFVLGDRPVVDELSLAQFAGLLVTPLVRAYVTIAKGTDGIVLYMRNCYLVLSFIAAAAVASVLARIVEWPRATLAATLLFAYAPWNIASPSYNTIGASLFTIGTTLGASALLARSPHWLGVVAGAAHALACFAYPALAPAVAAFAVVLVRLSTVRHCLPYAAGLAAVGSAECAYLLSFGRERWIAIASYFVSVGNQGGGLSKVATVLWNLARALPYQAPLVCAGAALAVGCVARRPWDRPVRIAGAVLVPLAILPVAGFDPVNRSNGVMLYCALASPAFLVWRGWSRREAAFLLAMCSAGLVGGAVFAYSSNNGLLNAGIGMAPAVLVTVVGSMTIVGRELPGAGPIRSSLPTAAVLALLLHSLFAEVYGDSPIRELTAEMTTGPYAGLRTTPQRAELLTAIQQALRRATRRQDRILAFDAFPGGYLMTDARPATPTVWAFRPEPVLEYYRRENVAPTVAVRRFWDLADARPNCIDEYVARRCMLVVVDPRFLVCRLAPSLR